MSGPLPTNRKRHQQTATYASPDLLTTVEFSLIAVMLALNLMLRFHDMGALIAQYNQF